MYQTNKGADASLNIDGSRAAPLGSSAPRVTRHEPAHRRTAGPSRASSTCLGRRSTAWAAPRPLQAASAGHPQRCPPVRTRLADLRRPPPRTAPDRAVERPPRQRRNQRRRRRDRGAMHRDSTCERRSGRRARTRHLLARREPLLGGDRGPPAARSWRALAPRPPETSVRRERRRPDRGRRPPAR
jgi:hypothetical protein